MPGGSNAEGGITISFEKLDRISVSADKKIVSFQPGHTWFDIYKALEKENLAVIGGRVCSPVRPTTITCLTDSHRSLQLVLEV